jgi:hypothetical protein
MIRPTKAHIEIDPLYQKYLGVEPWAIINETSCHDAFYSGLAGDRHAFQPESGDAIGMDY